MTRKWTRKLFGDYYSPSRDLEFLKKYKSIWIKSYKKISHQNYKWWSSFDINFWEIRDWINWIVSELTLDDIKLYLSKK